MHAENFSQYKNLYIFVDVYPIFISQYYNAERFWIEHKLIVIQDCKSIIQTYLFVVDIHLLGRGVRAS